MRIVFVIYSLGGGGAERVTAILSKRWAGNGHKVKIMTFADETANCYEPGLDVEYESLRRATLSRNLWHAIISNLSRIFILRRRLKSFEPDVVIGMMSTTSSLVALACIGLPCVTIGTERVHPPLDPLPPLHRFIRGISHWFHGAVIVQTKESAQWIRAHTAARVVHIIPNPLTWPLENREPILSPEVICLSGRLIILAAGRLVPQKGFSRLIEAFAGVQADHPSWDLVILGAGPERRFLEAKRDQSGLNGRVFFPGRAGNIGDWYQRASIFAMTSLFEGFPNALLEAMAYGLPVISTDCDTGPRDLIQHGVNGLLIGQSDHEALVAALRRLMEGEDLRRRLSENARVVVQNYAVDRISEQWFAAFNAISGHERHTNHSSTRT